MTTLLLNASLVLVCVLGFPSLLLLVVGGILYRTGSRSGLGSIICSIFGSSAATSFAFSIISFGSVQAPTWAPASGLMVAVAILVPLPFAIAILAVLYAGALYGPPAVIRRAIHLAAWLLPAAERDDYAEVRLAMLHQVIRRRGERWRMWPLLSNILFSTPKIALQRRRARARLIRAVTAQRRLSPRERLS